MFTCARDECGEVLLEVQRACRIIRSGRTEVFFLCFAVNSVVNYKKELNKVGSFSEMFQFFV